MRDIYRNHVGMATDLTAELLRAAAAHCKQTGISRARLATIVINDGKFFERVEAGGGLTVRTYEKFMAYFAEHRSAA